MQQFIDSYDFTGKKAIVRVDFNVPLDENFNITDDTRIRRAMPTLKKVLEKGGSVIYDSPNTKHTKEQGRSPEETERRIAPIPCQGLFRRNQLPKTGKPEPTHGTVALDNRL